MHAVAWIALMQANVDYYLPGDTIPWNLDLLMQGSSWTELIAHFHKLLVNLEVLVENELGQSQPPRTQITILAGRLGPKSQPRQRRGRSLTIEEERGLRGKPSLLRRKRRPKGWLGKGGRP